MLSAQQPLTTGMLHGTPRSTEIELLVFICLRKSMSTAIHSTKQLVNTGNLISNLMETISHHLWDGLVLHMMLITQYRLNLVSSKTQQPTLSQMVGDMILCIQPTGSGTQRKTTLTTLHGKVTQHLKRIMTEILVFKLIM